MVLILLRNTLESKVQVIFNMLKYFIVFILCIVNFSVFADSCVDYKGIPKINVLNPGHKTSVVLSDEPMEATVVDMMGKTWARIVAKSSVDANMKIREKRLPSGVYAVRFSNGKTQLIIMK